MMLTNQVDNTNMITNQSDNIEQPYTNIGSEPEASYPITNSQPSDLEQSPVLNQLELDWLGHSIKMYSREDNMGTLLNYASWIKENIFNGNGNKNSQPSGVG